MANTLWAYATMGREPGEGMMRGLERRAEALAGTFNAQNVANTLWAYATMSDANFGEPRTLNHQLCRHSITEKASSDAALHSEKFRYEASELLNSEFVALARQSLLPPTHSTASDVHASRLVKASVAEALEENASENDAITEATHAPNSRCNL